MPGGHGHGSEMANASINTKINLLFSAPDGRPSPELGRALQDEAARLDGALPPALSARAGIGLDPEEVAPALDSLGAGGRADFGAPGYQGLLWVVGPGGTMDELTGALEGVADRLGGLVDAERSAAVAGTEEIFIPGEGPLAGMYAVRRRPGDSAEHFHDFWRLEHTKLSMYIPGFRYRQLHAAGYASRKAAEVAGVGVADVDGAIEYFFDDIQFQVDMTKLDNFPEIYQDEKNFIDHDRSTFSYVRFLG